MIKKIKNILYNSDNKRVVLKNMFFLAILQGVNFLLPLAIIPLIISRIGLEKFGLLSFATATISYFLILSDYGFNLTATKEVSVNRESIKSLSVIFSSVMIIKISLMLLGFLILSIVINYIDVFTENKLLYIVSFGAVFGQCLFPVWFFQGIEKMKYITLLNSITKILYFFEIYFFVNKVNDFILVPFFYSLSIIISGVFAFIIIITKYKIKLIFPKMNILKKYLYDGWHIFISRVAVIFYTSGNVLILGFLSGNISVGIFTIAQKIITAISTIGSIINRALFPNLSQQWNTDKLRFFKIINKTLKIEFLLMLVVAVLILVFGNEIISFFTEKYVLESTQTLKILLISVLLVPLGGLFSQSFVTMGENKVVTKSTILTSFFNLLIVFWFIKYYDFLGLALTIVLVQLFQVFVNLIFYNKIKRKHLCVV